MSLVSEALRKARAQQLRQVAESGQLPPAIAPAPQRRQGLPLLLLVSVLSGLAGAAGVAFLWSRWPGPRPVAPAPSPPAPTVLPAVGGAETPQPSPIPAQALQAPRRARGETPAPAISQPPAEPTSPAFAQVAPTPRPKGPTTQEFVLRAPLPDGVLSLDFLVYGSGKSFARINGQEVTPGSTVEGFTVAQILEDRVILERRGETVVLKVR